MWCSFYFITIKQGLIRFAPKFQCVFAAPKIKYISPKKECVYSEIKMIALMLSHIIHKDLQLNAIGCVYSSCCTSVQQWKIWANMLHATCCTCCMCNSSIVHSCATYATWCMCCIPMQHLQQKQKCVQHRRKCI